MYTILICDYVQEIDYDALDTNRYALDTKGKVFQVPSTMHRVPIDMHWIPRARRHAQRNLVKKYASVKHFVTKNASKVLYGGA